MFPNVSHWLLINLYLRSLKTVAERVRFMYKHEAHWPLLQSIRKGGGGGAARGEKDSALSKQLRDAGNSAFTAGPGAEEDQTALSCYNDALLAAPADPWDEQGEDMALALANRSALYFRQKKFQECLSDTRLALKSGYPKHLKYKVYQRQAKCLSELKNFKEARNCYRDALNFLNFSKLSKDQKQHILNDINLCLEDILAKEEHAASEPDQPPVEDSPAIPPFPRNPKFPALHRGLTVKYDSARGRHVVATENLRCGTFLAAEEPVVSFLWSEQLQSHCSGCLARVTSLVPCYTCSVVVFCSDTCRARAWKTFHQFECKAVEAMSSAYQNIFVAYRAVAQKPLKYFLDNKQIFSTYDRHRGAGCYEYEYESDSESGDTEPDSEDESHELGGPYTSLDYQNLHNLVTHSARASEADKLAFATSASLMLFYLKINNYFGFNGSRDSDRELNDAEVVVGVLLYHLLEVALYNSQDICEASAWHPDKGVSTGSVGAGVWTTLALLNHSCCPNLARANVGTTQLLVATEDIRKGQEVSAFYTVQYHNKIISTRQSFLEDHYKLTCR